MKRNKYNLHDIAIELYLRIVEVTGIFILFIALMSFFALFSYCGEDPSFNTAIDGKISNILAEPGSYYSDIMIQLFGSSSYLLSLVIFSCGSQLVRYHYVAFWRFFLGIMTVPALDLSLSILQPGFCRTGIAGQLLLRSLKIDLADHMYQMVIAYCLMIFVIISMNFCTHFDWKCLHKKIPEEPIKKITDFLHKEESADNEQFLDDPILKSANIIDTLPLLGTKKNKEKKEARTFSKKIPNFHRPSFDLLKLPKEKEKGMNESELKERASNLINVLNDFGIRGEIIGVNPGPVVTLYELTPAAGIKSSRVIGLSNDIARYMSAVSARVAVISGRNALGIELPNEKRQTVYLREILESSIYKKSAAALPITLGKDIGGESIVVDLARMPHLLIAGTTGSGKSVGINAMIMSLLYKLSPQECKFIMVDPKMLELSVYNDIPHLLTPVVTDPKKAVIALKWAVHEMESRYVNMSKLGVRNIEGYNSKLASMMESGETLNRQVHTGFDPETGVPIYETQTIKLELIPYIVIVVDEMADLMLVAGKEIEIAVQRLAQMARAAGIHLIMATQRPSVDVITGTIKANFPTRISFQVSSKIDSRTILGEQGAEQLLGQGDMLYMASGGRTTRIHCPFVSDEEVEKVANYLKQQGEPQYIDDILKGDDEELEAASEETSGDDPMYKEAVNLVLNEGKASTSFLQRRLKIGYNRAARIVDMMETAGIVSAANHVGKREVLGR